mgnify:CR=1 FL=1
MIKTTATFFTLFSVLFSGALLSAQTTDSIVNIASSSIDAKKIAKASEVANTVLSKDTTLQILPSGTIDNKNFLVKKEDKFVLADNPLAAKYDSLWLKEMSKSASLFDVEYNPSLESVIQSFLKRRRGLMERMLTLSQFYFPMFEQELANYDIPLELKYLAIVESALNPRAKSRVGATGLWQFMYPTGKMYNLDVSSYVDERSDPIKATKAACEYLSKLYDIFGDWDLVLAAYNSGPGNVNKAIRRSGGYENYWNIRAYLPRETAGYVPAFLATMYLFEYAAEHGLKAKNVERPYFETDTIQVKHLITFDQISKLVNVTTEELEVLNPAYRLNIIPYVEDKKYALRLPLNAIGKFVTNEDSIYAYVEEELKAEEKILPQFVKTQDQIRYKVKSGDFLGKIAERYGVGVSEIKRWNGLRSNDLKIGQRLLIYSKKPVSVTTNNAQSSSTKKAITDASKVHTVQQGDSLWTISKKYPGISVENLRKWNGISGNNIKLGTKLVLCDCQP